MQDGVIKRAKTFTAGTHEVYIQNLELKEIWEGKKYHAITLEDVMTGIADEFLIPIDTKNGKRLGNELIDSVFQNESVDEALYEQIQGHIVMVELVKGSTNSGHLFIQSFRALNNKDQNDTDFDELDFNEF